MSGYVLHLPEDESVVLSGPVSRRLIEGGDGDAALLYIAVLKNHGSIDDERLRALLSWPPDRFQRALGILVRQGLVALPRQGNAPPPPPPAPQAADQRPEYTRADMARALEGEEFAGLTQAVEQGHPYAQILLERQDSSSLPSAILAVNSLLHSIGRIFQDNARIMDSTQGQHTDRKLRRRIQEKKMAMGHKPDDHEEQTHVGPAM